jgi:hypothetical protein
MNERKKLTFIREADEPLVCSMCDKRQDLVAALPVLGTMEEMLAGKAPDGAGWIGLCEPCVARILDGFAVARGDRPVDFDSIPQLDLNQGPPGEATLLCPCGGANLHHHDVRVYERREDEPTALRTTISQRQIHRDVACPDTGPSGRRDGLVIGFWCEACDRHNTLKIYQHKGNTFMGWRPGEIDGAEEVTS